MNVRARIAIVWITVTMAFGLPAHASDTQTVTITNFETVSATGCAGTEIGNYHNCGEPIVPFNQGSASAAQAANSDGSLWIADRAAGGGVGGVGNIGGIEERYGSSDARVQTDYLLTAPTHSVSLLITYRFDGASLSEANFGNGQVTGYVHATSYSARNATFGTGVGDVDCSDGTRLVASGQVVGTVLEIDTPPGIYTLRMSFSCGSALIQRNQKFEAYADIYGTVHTNNLGDVAQVSAAGQILSVTWTYVVP